MPKLVLLWMWSNWTSFKSIWLTEYLMEKIYKTSSKSTPSYPQQLIFCHSGNCYCRKQIHARILCYFRRGLLHRNFLVSFSSEIAWWKNYHGWPEMCNHYVAGSQSAQKSCRANLSTGWSESASKLSLLTGAVKWCVSCWIAETASLNLHSQMKSWKIPSSSCA